MMIYLAPLQGITDRIFRNLFPVYFGGVDRAVAPFVVPLKGMKPDSRQLRDVIPDGNRGIPTIPQIMSADPDGFVGLANMLYDLGCATVNWNLGCPFPMVVKKGRGAGMLCHPARVAAFLERALPALKPALSIKLRIGLAHPDEVFELLPVFNRFPLEELIIHPRTGKQMYAGEVDLDTFEACLKLTRHRVVYNGDIDSPEKLAMLAGRFGSVEGWMIGRGLLRNPFLAEEIKGDTPKSHPEKVAVLRAFHDRLFAGYSEVLYGPAHITNKMKEIWTYLGDFFPEGAKIKKRIRKTHRPDSYLDVVNGVFDGRG
jgi:tRNA-dihydrouridine synthase